MDQNKVKQLENLFAQFAEAESGVSVFAVSNLLDRSLRIINSENEKRFLDSEGPVALDDQAAE